MKPSSRVSKVRGSLTLAIGEKVRKLRASGTSIFNMSLGEPQEALHPRIQGAICDGIKKGNNRYTQVAGIDELREAVAKSLSTQDQVPYSKENVVICGGTKNALYSLLVTTLNPGEKVIIPSPYWPSYYDMVTLTGGEPVVVDCDFDGNLLLTSEILERSITDDTKWLMLNSPNNPSGTTYSRENLASIGGVLKEYPQVNVIWDDIYKNLSYSEPFCSLVQAVPELKGRVFTVGGVSKSHAMTGLRIGWCVGEPDVIKAMVKVQSHSITCASSIGQVAAIEALKIEEEGMDSFVDSYRCRMDMMVSLLKEIEGVKFLEPDGAFYVYAFFDSYMGSRTPDGNVIETDDDLAQYLLEEGKVVSIPGFAFGMSPALRLSYTLDEASLEAGLLSMKKTLGKLNR